MENLSNERLGFESIGKMYSPATNVLREDVVIAGVPCAWIVPQTIEDEEIVYYIHGGGFIYGSLESHYAMVSYFATALKRKMLLIDYRLAPEHPFPAGIDDCFSVITAHHQRMGTYGIIGDSAGGNIVMSLQLKLKAAKGALPRFSMLISPWVDLQCKNPSYEKNKLVDPVLSQSYLKNAAAIYGAGHVLTDPLLSPVNGDFQGLSPVLILCGTNEILEDDSRQLYERLVKSGVRASLKLFEGAVHVWPFTDIASAAAQIALQDLSAFARDPDSFHFVA